MNRLLRILTVATLLTLSLRAEEALKPKTLAGFGSSVCNGAGGGNRSYIRRLQDRMSCDGWTVLNISRGGDNTLTIQERWAPEMDENGTPVPGQSGPFLLPSKASYVLIGLSLGNEAYLDEQFCRNLPLLIETCRTNGMKVAVGNCYVHGNMTEVNAAKSRRVNLFISQLDVPSINFLGSVDNGACRWPDGLWSDAGHPNAQGHEELFCAIVPTLWQALEQGKPLPERAHGEGLKLVGHSLEFIPADPIHAFAEVFWVKATAEGLIASIEANSVSIEDTEVDWNGQKKTDRKFIPSGKLAVASITLKGGQLVYTGLETNQIVAELSTDWNMVVISHWYARGETELYVNGIKSGSVPERYTPSRFTLGGAEFRDWFVYRSALNSDEIALLKTGGMYPSSLEVYATLNDGKTGDGLVNRAQSLSIITLK